MSSGWLLSYRVDLRRWTIFPTWVLSSSSTPIYHQRKLDLWPSHSQIQITVSFFFPLLISCLRTFLSAPSTNARARFSQVGRTARGLGRLGYIFTYSHRKSGFKCKPENVHVDLAICVDWHEGSSNSPPFLAWIQDWTGECGYRKDLVFLKSWMC